MHNGLFITPCFEHHGELIYPLDTAARCTGHGADHLSDLAMADRDGGVQKCSAICGRLARFRTLDDGLYDCGCAGRRQRVSFHRSTFLMPADGVLIQDELTERC